MRIKSPNKKSKKQNKTKRIDRKSISKKLTKIKIYRFFRFLFFSLLIIFTTSFIVISYKNKLVTKILNNVSSTFNKNVYKNTCINIKIEGVEKTNVIALGKKIDKFCEDGDKFDLNILKFEIMHDPWIKNISIRRSIKNGLKINIDEYLPFALWKDGNEYYLIDENGKIINVDQREKKLHQNSLMIVIGEGSKEEIYSLFNLLSSNPSLFSKIKVANRIGKRRWDLTLNSGVVVKMPEKNIVDAWFKLDKIISIGGSEIDTKTIDLRNQDRVFIDYK